MATKSKLTTERTATKNADWPTSYRQRGCASRPKRREQQQSKISLARLDRAFQVQCEPTMGVELEFFLINQLTGEPAPVFDEIFRRLPAEIRKDTINEFLKCQIEYRTPICRDADECRIHLQRFIDAAGDVARSLRTLSLIHI